MLEERGLDAGAFDVAGHRVDPPGESFTLEITEGTTPFSSAFGTYAIKGDQRKSVVSLTLQYELQADAPDDCT